jgi:hypothetical protein
MKLSHQLKKEIYFDAEEIDYAHGESFYFEDISFALKLEAVEGDILSNFFDNNVKDV